MLALVLAAPARAADIESLQTLGKESYFAFVERADVVRAEIEDLHALGIDIVQLDEPWMESRADAAREYGIDTLQRALEGVRATTALHICFGYPLFVPGHKRSYRFLAELADALSKQADRADARAQLGSRIFAAGTGGEIVAVRPGQRPPRFGTGSQALVVWRPGLGHPAAPR